jgi:hypothetical protein
MQQHKQQICNCHKLESRSTQNAFLLSLFCVMLYQLKDILCWIGENITTAYSLSWTDNGHRGDNESCLMKMSRSTDTIQKFQVYANGTMIPCRRWCLSSSGDGGTRLCMAWKKLGFDSRWGQEFYYFLYRVHACYEAHTMVLSSNDHPGFLLHGKKDMGRGHLVPRLRMSGIQCFLGELVLVVVDV